MSRFVFVLGAGASAAAGGPIASDFMTKATRLLRGKTLDAKDADAFNLVFKAREALKAAHSKANLELGNLEVLFSAFEMAALFNRLGTLTESEVQSLPAAMRRLIAQTIEANLIFPVQQSPGGYSPQVLPAKPYGQFADFISKMAKNHGWEELSLITFNYDIAIDYALYFKGIPFDYGLNQTSNQLDLLKLHGSLNWRRCGKCNEIVPWKLEQYFQRYGWRNLYDVHEVKLQISPHIPEFGHCEVPLELDPMLIPPTWNKGSYQSQLKSVWRKAAKHLSEAEQIFIIGYSFPRTDEFFKYLYALGSIGDGWLERIMVFNPDPNVGERIEALLGPLAKEKFSSSTKTFDQAIAHLGKLILI